ncbi:MAG: response regulator [Clostridia bacterium]|nr:response regulator [Clostridia bacterium]
MFGKYFELNEQTMQIVREIGRHMPGGFFIYKSDNDELLYANAAVLKIFGCDTYEEFKELTGNTFKGMVYPDDYKKLSDSIADQIALSHDNLDYAEYRIVRKDGAMRWVDDYGHYTDTEAYGGIFYVFISDITEKHERMERDNLVRDAVIDTLTKTYNTVGLINDVETESFSLYHGDMNEDIANAEAINSALQKGIYTEVANEYINALVAEKDRDRMREELSLPNITQKLSEKDYFSVTFLHDRNGDMRYYRIDFGKVNMPEGHMGVMMGFKDVDDEVRTGQNLQHALESRLALQEKLLEEQEEKKERDKMITALASDYRSVYHVDLDADDGVCYRADPDDKDHTPVGVHFNYYERFKWYGENSVDEAYRDDFLEFINPDNIRKALLNNSIIAYRYFVHRGGKDYYEMIRMAGVRHAADRDDNIVHAIGLGLTNIDSEMRETLSKNQTLREALSAAQAANKAKTAFLSNMSHEIRTPMNAIIGLDNLARRKENLDDEVRDYLVKINDSAQHLLGLINDILDMSRIESGKVVVKKEKFSFGTMLEQINTMVMTQCSDKGLDYKCNILGGVSDYYIGDDMKLKQVLINTLSNAIKFTEAPGTVSLTVERTAVFDNQTTIKFIIEDTGIGMDKSFLPKIFETFAQEDSNRNNKYGSTGLGMPIAKSIVEIMNGTISVESEKGVGTKFTIVITLKNCEDREEEDLSIDLNKIKVLVVDDDEIAAEHARLLLDESGIKSDICLSGTDALNMLETARSNNEPYNLVLLDWNMPDMNGIAVAKEIRKSKNNETTIIIVTSYNWDDIMADAVSAGVDSFIAKPLFANNLISELKSVTHKNNLFVQSEKRRADLDGRHILIAEDIFINAEIMKELLKIKGVIPDHAENGKIALDMFKASSTGYYDAILMDIRMPEMDGLEATMAIRALDRADANKVPIIAMTANAFDEDVKMSLQAGINAHLSKPVESERLYETLEEFIWEADKAKQAGEKKA